MTLTSCHAQSPSLFIQFAPKGCTSTVLELKSLMTHLKFCSSATEKVSGGGASKESNTPDFTPKPSD
eukprot:scaffold169657_cov13-Tisochrysis_lutea.AAC.1